MTTTSAEPTLRWQRWLLAAMIFGSAVIILPSAVEPFMLPKMTFLVLAGIGLVVLGGVRALRSRVLHLPVSPATVAVAALALALLVTTVASPTPLASVVGFYSRYTGLVPYLVYLTVFLVVLRVLDLPAARLLARTALVAQGAVVGYGLLQAVGFQPVGYAETRNGTTFSFLGNVDFSSAWAGCVMAICLAVVLARSESTAWRWYAGILLPLTAAYLVVTGTVQGLATAAVALLTAGVVLATGPSTRLRALLARHPRRALTVGGAAGAAVGTAAVVGVLLFRSQLDRALVDRPGFWAAAVDIFADHPVIGTGLDTFAHHYLAYRPASLALEDAADTTDAPHSVVLGMFSNGGLLLGLTYVAVVVLVGLALLRGLRDVSGPARVPFAGFAGVWVGYQAQSFVSFDVPPLALLHWVSAGVIVALAAPPAWREVRLPGYRPAPTTRKGRPVRTAVPAAAPASTRVALGALVVLSLGAAWLALYPLRADLVAASAAPLGDAGELEAAAERLDRAAALNPAEASYPWFQSRAYGAMEAYARSYATAAEAARRDPGTVQYALQAGRQARRAGLDEEANRWYRNAIARDPNDPPVLNEVAAFYLDSGQTEAAEELASRSVSLRADVDVLLLLAEAREQLGDVEGARAAYERVLAREPDNADATERLADLSAE